MTPYELLLIFRSKLTGELILVDFQHHHYWYHNGDTPDWTLAKEPLHVSRRDYADLEMYGWGVWSVPPSRDTCPWDNFIQHAPCTQVGISET